MAIADGTTKAQPVHTHDVSVDTTDPGSSSAIQRLPTACVVLNEPFITVEEIAVNARDEMFLVGAMKFAAALLISPVSGPCSDQISPTAASTASASRTSTAWTCAPGPISAAASSSTVIRRPHRCTSAPCLTRCAATPRPRPVPPPVIRMRLPARTFGS